jgi:hypothetical protein
MSPINNKTNQDLTSDKNPKVVINRLDVFAHPHQVKSEIAIKQENNEIIETKKFYSSKTPSNNINNNNNNQQNNQDETKKTPKKDKSSKKPSERLAAPKNAQLGNWQANLTSQLFLPEDFTPELISQLAAEGYDVVSAGGRKARTKTHQVNQPSLANTLIDSSDEENDNEYNPARIDAKQPSSNQKPKNNVNMDEFKKSRFDRNNLAQMDSNDITEHHSFKRFNHILDDLLESYEEDLQQIKLNNVGKKSSKKNARGNDDGEGSPSSDEEIPSEYLLARQICHDLMQESFRLNSLSIMNAIKKENLSKLQNLLYFNIKDSKNSVKLLNEVNI